MDLKRELEAIDLTLAELEEQRTEIINRLYAAARKPAAIGRPRKLAKVIPFPGKMQVVDQRRGSRFEG